MLLLCHEFILFKKMTKSKKCSSLYIYDASENIHTPYMESFFFCFV